MLKTITKVSHPHFQSRSCNDYSTLLRIMRQKQIETEMIFQEIYYQKQKIKDYDQKCVTMEETLRKLKTENQKLSYDTNYLLTEQTKNQQELVSLRQNSYNFQSNQKQLKEDQSMVLQQLEICQKKLRLQEQINDQLNQQKLELEDKMLILQNEFLDKEYILIQSIPLPPQQQQQESSELLDLQKYFKIYFHLIQELIEQFPFDQLREDLQKINFTFKQLFNAQQEVSDIISELEDAEQSYKQWINQNQNQIPNYMQLQDKRRQIEDLRKDMQEKYQQMSDLNEELDELKQEYLSDCQEEAMRFRHQLHQERLLIDKFEDKENYDFSNQENQQENSLSLHIKETRKKLSQKITKALL